MEICVNRKWNNGPLHVTVMSAGSGALNVAIRKSEILASPVFFLGINVPLRHFCVTTVPLKRNKYYIS